MSSALRSELARSVVVVAVSGLLSGCASAPFGGGCSVSIDQPTRGAAVALVDPISGVGSTPFNYHIWVFTHRQGVDEWWPQNGAPVKGYLSGGWTAQATFGAPEEAGYAFEVAALAVDDAENAELMAWVARSEATGAYPGITLPWRESCARAIVAVRRAP